MTEDQEREYLTSKGWEMPLSEEDGCETWRLPPELRRDYPEQLVSRTQHYWDREDAVRLQVLMDRIGPKTIREDYIEISKELREHDAARQIIVQKLRNLQNKCKHPNSATWKDGMECPDCGLRTDK